MVYIRLMLSVNLHSTSSSLHFVQPSLCSIESQRTLRFRQRWQAFEALGRKLRLSRIPAAADLFSPAAEVVLGLASVAVESGMAGDVIASVRTISA